MKLSRELSGTTSLLSSAPQAAQARQHMLSLLPGRRPRACFRRGEARLLSLSAHELGPERALGFVLVMSAASQAHPIHRPLSPSRNWVHMVEFKKAA